MRPIEVAREKSSSSINPGSAPILQWVKVKDLVVDDSYQRELKFGNWAAIRRIAAKFKWSRFSPVFVAPIEGGKYAIIDGQHRTHAAAMCGIEEVPCQIVHMSRDEQAAAFAAVNGLVTKVTLWHIYKAALVAGEEWATDCFKVCNDAGCELMTTNMTADVKKPGQIFAIALVRQFVSAGHGAEITFALKGLRTSEFGQDAAAYANEILKPVFVAISERNWLRKQGADLSKFFDQTDIYAIIDKSNELSKQKRRQGYTGISKYDITAAELGSAMDKAFPQRIGLPPPLGRKEVMDRIAAI